MKKSNTKLMEAKFRQYLGSTNRSLGDVYDRYSQAKEEAWEACKAICKKYDGRDLKVVSYNDNYFTAGFLFTENGKDNFCWITKDHVRYAQVIMRKED